MCSTELDETVRDGIRAAQARQIMVNPPPTTTDPLSIGM
jgi:hypothetical protein